MPNTFLLFILVESLYIYFDKTVLMKLLLPLSAFIILFSSCFTSSLLDSNLDVSSIPPDTYRFNRAYYSSDSLLHIDFENLKNNNPQKRFSSLTIDLNNILAAYDNSKLYRSKYYRPYNVMSISNLVCDTNCNVNYHNTSLLVFGDEKVRYSSDLTLIQDSSLLTYTDLLNDACILTSGTGKYSYYTQQPINNPKDVYVLQTLRDPNRFVALRIPLVNGDTKLGLLPVTIMLDIITSPFQLGFFALTHKSDHGDEHRKRDKHEHEDPPINPHLIHKPH